MAEDGEAREDEEVMHEQRHQDAESELDRHRRRLELIERRIREATTRFDIEIDAERRTS